MYQCHDVLVDDSLRARQRCTITKQSARTAPMPELQTRSNVDTDHNITWSTVVSGLCGCSSGSCSSDAASAMALRNPVRPCEQEHEQSLAKGRRPIR